MRAWWMVVTVGLVGCGGSDGGSGGQPTDTFAGFESAYLAASCDWFDRCWGGLYDDVLGCGSDHPSEGALAGIGAALDRETVTYDADAAAACLDAVRGASCEAGLAAFVAPCRAVVTGHVEAGGACESSAECGAADACRFDGHCAGTCTAAGEGTACAHTDECATGLLCDRGGHCARPAAAGEACATSCDAGTSCAPPCDFGLACVPSDAGSTCRALSFAAGAGETCDPSGGVFCGAGLSCSAHVDAANPQQSAWRCDAAAESGGPCTEGLPDPCPDDEFCRGGACQARAGEGGDCDERAPASCERGLTCVGGACRALVADGDACESDDACASGTCTDGRCAPSACAR